MNTHQLPCRVYYEDTDAAGIVYHANHLKFAERGRTEMLRSLGYDHQRVMQEFNIVLIVRHIEIDYRMTAKLDDLLEVHTSALTIGNSSLTLKQVIVRGVKEIAILKVIVVAVTPEGKPVRLPAPLRHLFEG